MSAETTAAPAPSSGSAIDNFFKLAERGTSIGTEARAGLTTFMVMAYIIFLNPNILMAGFADRPIRTSRRSRWPPARR